MNLFPITLDLSEGATKIVELLVGYLDLPRQVLGGKIELSKEKKKVLASLETDILVTERLNDSELDPDVAHELLYKHIGVRASVRAYAREVKKQQNLENVVQKAIEAIGDDKPGGEVSEDWAEFFFEACESVSDDEMRVIFAKILTGEIKKPGSISKRAISLVKQLSKEEGQVFAQWGARAVLDNENSNGMVFCPLPPDDAITMMGIPKRKPIDRLQDVGIQYSNYIDGLDVGVLAPDDNSWLRWDQQKVTWKIGKEPSQIVTFSALPVQPDSYSVNVPIVRFTRPASELLPILSIAGDKEYSNALVTALLKHDFKDVSIVEEPA